MGLLTDSFFIQALESNEPLVAMLPAHGFYNNVAYPDVDMQNADLPYIIVNNDGGRNKGMSKDDMMEGPVDQVNISIRIVGRNREELNEMAVAVRKTIHDYVVDAQSRVIDGEPQEGDELCPNDYAFSFSDIAYDMLKPSVTLILNYDCETDNDLLENS